MSRSAVEQTNFLGGEWSPRSRGRIDLPPYKTALEVSSNGLPADEGAWTRRVGTLNIGTTYRNSDGIVEAISLSTTPTGSISTGLASTYSVRAQRPAILEITYSAVDLTSQIRVWSLDTTGTLTYASGLAYAPMVTATTAVSSFSGTTITVAATASFSVGDSVYFLIGTDAPAFNKIGLANRQFRVTAIGSGTTITVADVVTGVALNATEVPSWTASGTNLLAKALKFAGPWTSLAEVKSLRIVATDSQALILSSQRNPYLLTWVASGATTPPFTFAFTSSGFISTSNVDVDGPFLDAPVGLSQTLNGLGTISAGTTTPTFQITDSSGSFAATDVGRQIRLWSQPPLWAVGTTYAAAAVVTYNGVYWKNTSGGNSTGQYPGTAVTSAGVSTYPWSLVEDLGVWSHGVITAYTNSTTVVCLLKTALPYSVNGAVIDTYRLGVYNDTTLTYPTCGSWDGGRLWLGGAVANRFDISMANGIPYGTITLPAFSTTDKFGQVNDDHGISEVLNSPTSATMLWMEPDHVGMIIGTMLGEWLIAAATSDDVISPLSIKSRQISSFGSSATPRRPIRVGQVLLFVDKSGYFVKEFFPDSFSGKFLGRDLNARFQDTYGFTSLAYQPDRIPIVWGADPAGNLYSCTYRRQSDLSSTDPTYVGWARHRLGSDNAVVDLVSLPTPLGGVGTTVFLTHDTTASTYQLEQLSLFWSPHDATAGQPTFMQDGSTFYLDGVMVSGGSDAGYTHAAVCNIFGSGLTGDHVVTTNGGLTVQGGNYAANEIANTCAVSPGYYYFEVTYNSGNADNNDGVGFQTSGATAANIANSWTNGVGFGTFNGNIYVGGSSVGVLGQLAPGTVLTIAVDLVTGWMHIGTSVGYGPSLYHNSAGYNISSVFTNISSKLCALFRTSTADKFTIANTGFAHKIPPGYATGWQGVIPNEASYSALDTTTAVACTFGPKNYGASAAGAIHGARSLTGFARGSGGKRYCEFWSDQVTANDAWVGVCDSTQALNAAMNASHAKGVLGAFGPLGRVYNNSVGRIVIDLTNSTFYIKGNDADAWNNDALANPATDTGGVSISALGSTVYVGFCSVGADSMRFVLINNPEWFNYSVPATCTGGW